MEKQLEFLESKQMREELISKVDVLDKVKSLILLPATEFATTRQVAEYYQVGIEAVKSIRFNNYDELLSDGIKEFSSKELKEFLVKSLHDITNHRGYFTCSGEKFSNGKTLLFTKRAILRVGMLLRDSEVAKEVRDLLLKENPELYSEMMKENNLSFTFKKYETEIKNYLEFTFGKENVKYQVKCGKYRLDFVLFNTIHIEVDENGHSGYNIKEEKERQDYIFDNTDYYTIRYNPQNDMPYQLILDIFELFDNIGYPKEIRFRDYETA